MQDVYTALAEAQIGFILAALVILLLWESAHPFFDYFRRDPRERTRHAFRNLVLGSLNAVLVAVVFAGLWLASATWADAHGFGLLHVLSRLIGLPLGAHAVGAVLLLDAWTYVWHRLNHRIPFLWRFHRVHHADGHMDVTTASRFHVGELFFSSLLRIPLIALIGIYAWELVAYELVMFTVVQFHHANIALPERLDRILRLVIVTPAVHKVHHSAWRPETDSNYGSLFTFWDRIGRSWRIRPDLQNIRLGLDEAGDDTLLQMLKGPFGQRMR